MFVQIAVGTARLLVNITLEKAVHFSLAAFTTLGLGDVVPATE